jgi:glucokinase
VSAVLGIDYGGTRTKLLLARRIGDEWELVAQRSIATASGSVTAIVDEVRAFVEGEHVSSFGITVPGVLDEASGTVLRSTNLPWLDATRPADDVRAAVPTLGPGVAVQDGSAAALAEATLGAGRGHRDVFVVTLGTGVAGAHLIDGEIHAGAHGAAGEIGHVAVGGDLRCSCGGIGCLETFIGGRNLGTRWDALGSSAGVAPSGAREVVEAADAGDVRAVDLLDEATGKLAQGLLGLIATVDPGVIVLGGGVAQAHDRVVAPTVAKVSEGATFHTVPPIAPAQLGPWAGAWGAVLRADAVVRASVVA